MTFDWTTFALQLLNVIVLLAILRHYLFKPVAAIIAARQAAAEQALDAAAQAKAEAESAEAAAEAAKAATEAARHAVLVKAQSEAAAAQAAALEKARSEAAAIVAAGTSERARDAAAAEAQALDRARSIAAALASRALAAQPKDMAGYVARLDTALAALSEPERTALLAGAGLRLVSPVSLRSEDLHAAQQVLGKYGVTAEAKPDAALISGLELRSETGVLHNSLAHDLELLTKAMRDDRPAA